MPLQRISVKNNDVENWITSSTEPVYTQESSRLGSTSSNISFSNNDICRICHCEADNLNPLLAPCYCSGSLKYVHQACLQQWLTASETRSCELCKFNFIMHTKIKPFNEWRRLDMSGVERRRLCCAVLFHCVAALCVVWSLFVLIDRAAEEVQKGIIAWPFWTKLVVVAVGFTGGAVFMYIQCRQYLHLCNRWRAHNRIILIQNAPEKAVVPPSPTFRVSVRPSMTSVPSNGASTSIRPAQVIANIESNPLNNNSISDNNSHHLSNSNNSTQFNYPLALISDSQQNGSTTSILDYPLNLDSSYVFGEKNSIIASTSKNAENMFVFDEKCNLSSGSSIGNNFTNSVHSGQELMKKSISNSEDVVKPAEDIFFRIETPGFDPLEINIQEMLALDIEHTIKRSKTAKNSIISLADVQNIIEKKHFEKNKSVFKSLPNLNTRNETLLP